MKDIKRRALQQGDLIALGDGGYVKIYELFASCWNSSKSPMRKFMDGSLCVYEDASVTLKNFSTSWSSHVTKAYGPDGTSAHSAQSNCV